MIPGGFGSISGGAGGISADLGGGPSSAGSGDNAGGSGNNTWNFAPPQYQVTANRQQAAGQQWQTVAIVAGVLVAAWAFTRKR